MVRVVGFAVVVASVGALAACAGEPGSEDRVGGGAEPGGTSSIAGAEPEMPADRTCPLTLPNGSVPPGVADWVPEASYGTGELWTQFWPFNVVIASSG